MDSNLPAGLRRNSGPPSLVIIALVLVFCETCRSADTLPLSSTNLFPKSVFEYNSAGKDPFFPKRQRFGQADVPNSNTNPPPSIANQFKLTGISQGARTIATINNLTFEAGEEQEVKVFNGKRKIRVLEISEKSVRVKVEGEADPIELVLPDRVLKFDE